MLKNISNLGKTLSKKEQKMINGGRVQSISAGSAYCICTGPGPYDEWSGTTSSCDRCIELCASGNAFCIG